MQEVPGSRTPARSPLERRALVEHVYGNSHDLQETDWLEWKSRYDLTKAAGRAATAKQILGFANRMPDVAQRQAGGYSYLLLGVEPGTYHGMPAHDPADIETWLRPYLGENVRFDVDYVAVGEKRILFVTVDPPRWGDDIHSWRYEGVDEDDGGKNISPGTIFVRKPGKTERAAPADIDRLTERARRQGTTLALSVEVDAPLTALPPNCFDDDVRDRYLEQRKRELLAHVPPGDDRYGVMHFSETRSPGGFRASVDTFVEAAREQWVAFVTVKLVEERKPVLRFTLVNTTDENFEAVQVELSLPLPQLLIFNNVDDVRKRVHVPTEPREWGTSPLEHIDLSKLPRLEHRVPDIESTDDEATTVRLVPVHARPQSRHALGELIIAATPNLAAKTLTASWRATSTSTRGEERGEVSFTVAPSPALELAVDQ